MTSDPHPLRATTTPTPTSEVDHLPAPTSGEAQPQGRLATLWSAMTAVIGAVMGLLPHVLHHAGLLVGAAFITGVGGNLAFGALGLLFSLPLLRRLYRRFGTWKAPAAGVAVFVVLFSLSAFVIGPAISGDEADPPSGPVQTPSPQEHGEHHDG